MPNDNLTPTGAVGVSPGSDTPQFTTAEYAHIPGTERCRICNSLISGEYFRVNGQMACGKCAGEASHGQPSDSHAAFARALLLGAGAAMVGLALYATFAIVTGLTIGYLALAVGWLVAKGMMKGSNGVGGLRYQVVAVLLTYAAISMSSIPIIISQLMKDSHAKTQQSQQASVDSDADAQQLSSASGAQKKEVHLGAAAAQLALWGLASPFLELAQPGSGILGLIILFVGL